MISDYKNGGLKIVNIKVFNRALKYVGLARYLITENTPSRYALHP